MEIKKLCLNCGKAISSVIVKTLECYGVLKINKINPLYYFPFSITRDFLYLSHELIVKLFLTRNYVH